MDEIVLKKIQLTVNDLSLWESFLTDVMDLNVVLTRSGIEIKLSALCFELIAGASSPIEWIFEWGAIEREVILSRWSFYQYRGADSIRLIEEGQSLVFVIDSMARIVIHFEALQAFVAPDAFSPIVRNF